MTVKPRTVLEAAELAGDLISLAWAAGDDDEEIAWAVCHEFRWTCFETAMLVVALHRVRCVERGEPVGAEEGWP